MSSDFEGLPMVLLEAMAMKKVIIATDVGGISEVIKDEDTGFLIKKGDSISLAQRIIQVLRNLKEYKQTIGVNAYNLVLNDYNINDYVSELSSIYMKLFKSKKNKLTTI